MGNLAAESTARKLFEKADGDDDGRLNLEELMGIENIDHVVSPMMLFQLDAEKTGAVNKEEFAKLLEYLHERSASHAQDKPNHEHEEETHKGIRRFFRTNKKAEDSEKEKPALERFGSEKKLPLESHSHSNIVVSLDSQIADQLALDRDHETPMIIGGPLAHPSLSSAEASHSAEAENDDHRLGFCKQLLSNHHGRQEFVSWLWRLADMHHTEKVTEKELELVLEALKHDGINLAHLSFENQSKIVHSESENEGTSSSSDDDLDGDQKIRYSSPISFRDFKALTIDAPTPETLPSYLSYFEKHKVSHMVRLCVKSSYPLEPIQEAGIEYVPLITGFVDGEVPTAEFLENWRAVVKSAREKQGAVAVHGLTGGSRAALLCAISLIDLGMSPYKAIKLVRKKRRGAINQRQEKWLHRFKKIPTSKSSTGIPIQLDNPELPLDHTIVERIIGEFDSHGSGYLSKEDFMVFANLIVHAYKALSEEKQVIGKYIVGEKLGEGAVGTVRLATDQDSGERKAIKIISRGRVTDMSKLDTEARAMMMLKHPSVVRLHEVLENESNVFFVMDLCSGGSLENYIAARPCSEAVARSYFRQLVEGVIYCHSQGVAHRDLKLENLLLDEKGQLKITDFGQAMIFPEDWDVCSTSVVGTSYHLTPEQIEGEGYSAEKKDTWSVGIILFQLLVGKPPFWNTNVGKMLDDIKNLHYEIPSYLSPEVQQLIRGLLAGNPDDRIALTEVLPHPWMTLGPSQAPDLTVYIFPLGPLEGIFGDHPTTVQDIILQWETHWKVTLHKQQIVGVPVHESISKEPPPPDSLCRIHCFSPEQNGLKFTLSLCTGRSSNNDNIPIISSSSSSYGHSAHSGHSTPAESIVSSSPALLSGRVSPHPGKASPGRSSPPSGSSLAHSSPSSSSVFLLVNDIFPTGLFLRFDLFSGSVWNFFKTVKALHQSIVNLSHPLTSASETRSKSARKSRSRTRKSLLPSSEDSKSRPSSPNPNINKHVSKGDDERDSSTPLSRATTPKAREVSTVQIEISDVIHTSASSSSSSRPGSRRHHHREDSNTELAQLNARVTEQDDLIKGMLRTIERQDETIKNLQRQVETLRSDMFQMQGFQSQMLAGKGSKTPQPQRLSNSSSATS